MQKINVYTENKDNVFQIVSEFVDSFTLTETLGYYKGTKEKSVIITLFVPLGYTIKGLIDKLLTVNNQESVLVEYVGQVTVESVERTVTKL